MKFSAIITCMTECSVTVEASTEAEARIKIERGEFSRAQLHDGGLDMPERFHDIDMVSESFGADE